MIRRIKSDVEKKIPPKVEKLIKCPIARAQRMWYLRLLRRDLDILTELGAIGAEEPGDGADADSNEAAGTAISSRYKRHLAVGTSAQPPLLAAPSDTESGEDGLVAAIRELSPDDIASALEAQGVEATPDADRNVELLVRSLKE